MILNDTYLIHFHLKKQLFIIILLIGILLTSFYFGFNSQNYSYNSNVYVFNTSNLKFENIKLMDSYKKSSVLNDKIAPGVSGNFSIVIDNNTNDIYKYSFICKENSLKPKGLYFKLDEVIYYELSDLVNQINGTLEANELNSIDISWGWEYQGNDFKDTQEGKLALDYFFEISLISVKL